MNLSTNSDTWLSARQRIRYVIMSQEQSYASLVRHQRQQCNERASYICCFERERNSLHASKSIDEPPALGSNLMIVVATNLTKLYMALVTSEVRVFAEQRAMSTVPVSE